MGLCSNRFQSKLQVTASSPAGAAFFFCDIYIPGVALVQQPGNRIRQRLPRKHCHRSTGSSIEAGRNSGPDETTAYRPGKGERTRPPPTPPTDGRLVDNRNKFATPPRASRKRPSVSPPPRSRRCVSCPEETSLSKLLSRYVDAGQLLLLLLLRRRLHLCHRVASAPGRQATSGLNIVAVVNRRRPDQRHRQKVYLFPLGDSINSCRTAHSTNRSATTPLARGTRTSGTSSGRVYEASKSLHYSPLHPRSWCKMHRKPARRW